MENVTFRPRNFYSAVQELTGIVESVVVKANGSAIRTDNFDPSCEALSVVARYVNREFSELAYLSSRVVRWVSV